MTRRPGHHQLPVCPACGAELTTVNERRENVCRHLKCRGPRLQQLAAAQRAREDNKQRALDNSAERSLREQFPEVLKQTETGDLLLIVVPGIDSAMVPVTDERTDAFRRTLEESFAQAKELVAQSSLSDPPSDGDKPPEKEQQEEETKEEQPLELPVVNACSTCRGWCCRMGHAHAYLSPEYLAWRLTHERDLTADEMIEDYMSRIPEQAQNGSCVYHTPTGCVLPRSIRGRTCNAFLCPGLARHREVIRDAPDRATAVVSVDDRNYMSFGEIEDTEEPPCVRLGVMDSDGNRTEYPLQVLGQR